MTATGQRVAGRAVGRAVGAVTAAVLGLAACGSGDRIAPELAADAAAHPVVALGQAATVVDSVDAALLRARGSTSKAKLGPRVLGPFRQLVLAEAVIDRKRKQKTPAPGEFTLRKALVPTSTAWPRFFVLVGELEGAPTPVLRVLTSSSARSPYGLWAQPAMLPGATLPQVAAPDVGAATLPAGVAAGLAGSPAELATRYAKFLNDGAKQTELFRRSSFGDQLVQRLAADRKALKKVATVGSRHEAVGTPLALRTVEGGALVVVELRQTYTIKPRKGRKVAITNKDLAALAGGKKQFGTSLTRTSVEVVVLDVPPAGRGPIQVVAAQKGDVKAVVK